MTPVKVGERVLRGMQRRDLYTLPHPQFADRVRIRAEVPARAILVEPANEPPTARLRQYGTLLVGLVDHQQRSVVSSAGSSQLVVSGG